MPPTPPSERALVCLGSNWGDPRANVERAFVLLQSLSDQPVLRSSLWESTPVDCPPGSPLFVNAAASIIPRLGETPLSLLTRLQAIEKEMGRRPKKVLNEARMIDLDLIAYGQNVVTTPELTLPHPRARRRKFVLEPLNEIAPDYVLPAIQKSVRELLSELHSTETVRRISS